MRNTRNTNTNDLKNRLFIVEMNILFVRRLSICGIIFFLIFNVFIILDSNILNENFLVFGYQPVKQYYPIINVTKLTSFVESTAEFKEKINGYTHYSFATVMYKLKPHENIINNTIHTEGPFDLVYSLYANDQRTYVKTLVVTTNSQSKITSIMEYPSENVPVGYPRPAETSFPTNPLENSAKLDPNKLISIIPSSPREQVKSGIAVNDVECFWRFELIFKAMNGSPACVEEFTAKNLTERGWAVNQTNQESISIVMESPKNVSIDKNGTTTAILTIDIGIKNFQRMSPPLTIQVFYSNGTSYLNDKVSSNAISQDGNYKYVFTISSPDSKEIFAKHKITVIHNGNISLILADIAHP